LARLGEFSLSALLLGRSVLSEFFIQLLLCLSERVVRANAVIPRLRNALSKLLVVKFHAFFDALNQL